MQVLKAFIFLTEFFEHQNYKIYPSIWVLQNLRMIKFFYFNEALIQNFKIW
jgi:hypothetical protein